MEDQRYADNNANTDMHATQKKIVLFLIKRPARLEALPRLARFCAALGCVVLARIAHPAGAAVTEAWAQRYNGPANGNDVAYAVAVDAGGNVVVTGYSSGRYTAKYAAANGALLWEKRYNDGESRAVAVDVNGNVVVAGSSWNGKNNDYYTAKYAATDGALIWERRYDGPAINDYDFASAVAVDTDGNVVVTGYSGNNSDFFNADYYTAKYAAADGALLWEKRYNGPSKNDDYPTAVAVDGHSNVVVTGNSATVEYAAADGALIWANSLGGNVLAVDGENNVVVAGENGNGNNSDGSASKLSAANGAVLWQRLYNGPGNAEDAANAVAVDASGNVVVTGRSNNGAPNWDDDYYTAKYAAADGAVLWEKRYYGPANSSDQASAVAVDGSGNVVVTGVSQFDYYTAKYAAADGALLWEKRRHDTADSGHSMPDFNARGGSRFIALGPNGMVAITGSAIALGNSDFETLVYWESLPPVALAMPPEGVRLRFTGVPNHSCNIERAPSVTGPWSTIATRAAPPDGVIEFVDTNAPPSPVFYRTSAP